MSKCKIDKKNLNQCPILFFIEVCEEEILYFFHLHKTFPNFQHNAQPEKLCHFEREFIVDDQDHQADEIDEKFVFEIVKTYIFQCYQLATMDIFNGDEIDHDFDREETHAKSLEIEDYGILDEFIEDQR